MTAVAPRGRVRRDRPHPPAPSPIAMGEGESLIRGRAKPSPDPPNCRGAAASRRRPPPVRRRRERGRTRLRGGPSSPPDPPIAAARPLPAGHLPQSAAAAEEGETLAQGRDKPSSGRPDCRCAATSRRRPPPVRRRERGRTRLRGGPSSPPSPRLASTRPLQVECLPLSPMAMGAGGAVVRGEPSSLGEARNAAARPLPDGCPAFSTEGGREGVTGSGKGPARPGARRVPRRRSGTCTF